MVGFVGTLLLVLAQITQPAPSVTPPAPKTIIRIKSTPFCTVFRENVFHAVEGLRVNDMVIDQGQLLLSKWAYDSIADTGKIEAGGLAEARKSQGPSVKMDQYQLGEVVHQAAHNVQRVYALLNDPQRFPQTAQDDATRDLIKMKAVLQAVADAQERSIDILSGTYETAALLALLSFGNNTVGALQQGSSPDQNLQVGDQVFNPPGYLSPPASAAPAQTSLFASTPIGRIRSAVVISQRITGGVENNVADAVISGIKRCGAQ
jgi:hypothetical protein